MITILTYYGYSDGSGEYYIVIDVDKCDGCHRCVEQCPQSALEMMNLLVDLEDKTVAAVTERHRRNIKYTCSTCKPESKRAPCVLSCAKNAIECVWNPH